MGFYHGFVVLRCLDGFDLIQHIARIGDCEDYKSREEQKQEYPQKAEEPVFFLHFEQPFEPPDSLFNFLFHNRFRFMTKVVNNT